MTRDEFVSELIGQAKRSWEAFWTTLPDDQRLRLSGIEDEVRAISRQIGCDLWLLVGQSLENSESGFSDPVFFSDTVWVQRAFFYSHRQDPGGPEGLCRKDRDRVGRGNTDFQSCLHQIL